MPNKLRFKLDEIRLWWKELKIKALERRIGSIIEVTSLPEGMNSWYIGVNYHHPLYPKLKALKEDLEAHDTWTV